MRLRKEKLAGQSEAMDRIVPVLLLQKWTLLRDCSMRANLTLDWIGVATRVARRCLA